MDKESKAVIGIAKRQVAGGASGEHTLSTGVAVRLTPVSMTLIAEAQATVPEPPVPMWHNEDKDKDEPNPDHPDYLKAVAKADEDRNRASLDALVMFGVDLVDGVPEDSEWIPKLKFSKKMGFVSVDLDSFDLTNKIELEYLYKRYVALATPDMVSVMKYCAGVGEEEVSTAAANFQDNT